MSLTAHRATIKRQLARIPSRHTAFGLSVLIYHRVGGDTSDERDITVEAFGEQMGLLKQHRVVPLDLALDEVAAGDDRPKAVITFDDGFADVATTALPVLVEHQLPFTLYLATAYVGAQMHWDGSTAKSAGPALTWDQVGELLDTGLCTIGNHTHTHVRPERLVAYELDRCTKEVESHVGVTPQHFAYPWGIAVPRLESALRQRFRSAATGVLGRNHPGDDPMRLRRIPVRGSDPLPFFESKLLGSLAPERAYDLIVRTAKGVGLRA